MRAATPNRLLVVFGAGGDRDAGKRPEMGRIVGELAELPVATSDNPRSEDPEAILDAVEDGLQASGNDAYVRVADRREGDPEIDPALVEAAQAALPQLGMGRRQSSTPLYASRAISAQRGGNMIEAIEPSSMM